MTFNKEGVYEVELRGDEGLDPFVEEDIQFSQAFGGNVSDGHISSQA